METRFQKLPQLEDYLDFANDPQVYKGIYKEEKILFADKMWKFNRYDWKQERNLVITNAGIYNLKKKSVKRRITINKIAGITKSKDAKSLQFVLHVPEEYDYRFAAQRRDNIITFLKKIKLFQSGKNLPIFGVPMSNLKDFTQTRVEKQSRMPTDKNRLFEEDLINQKDGKKAPSKKLEEQKSDDPFDVGRGQRSNTLFTRTGKNEVLQDFDILKVIGKGTFGKVFLVQKRDSKDIYAMKSLRKDVLIDYDQIENTKLEKEILLRAKHPFLVSMDYVFQNDQKIFFVMRFVQGGELFHLLNSKRRFEQSMAKFYAAQVILAIGYLHDQNIIYRDLKPQNILIDKTDFGLAKMISDKSFAQSFCGTPQYLAPEIITGEGHNKPVDWWSVGILIYEMIVGIPPFYHRNQNTMYEIITKFPVRFPDPVKHSHIKLSEEAQSIINKLLHKDQKMRLGSKGGMNQIMDHPWFEGFNFKQLYEMKVKPPYIPKLSGDPKDTSQFDSQFTQEDPVNSQLPESAMSKIKKHQADFNGF